MFEAVLLEMEGVLADTTALRRDALIGSLAAEGVSLTPSEFDEHCARRPLAQSIDAALRETHVALDATARELVTLRAERAFLSLAAHGLSLAEGAKQLLESASGRTRLALVTRATRRETDLVLSLSGAAELFECVITADDMREAKPSPAPYARALTRLGTRRAVTPSRALALEDGTAGARSARAAGLPCIAVGNLPAYCALEADACVPSLAGASLERLAELLVPHDENVR